MLFSACQPVEQATSEPTDGWEVIDGEEATFESIEVLILESFPVQVLVNVTGYLPDGCVTLDGIGATRDGFKFTLTPFTHRPAGEVECTEALVPFEESVALEVFGLPAGTYTVRAQEQTATFTLDVDNVLEEPIIGDQEGSEGANMDAGIVYLDAMAINLMESFPVQVSVTLTGNLADGCTKLQSIESEREGQTFTILLEAKRPAGQMCTQALVPFEETVSLDVYGLPAGEYTVMAGDLTESFTLEMDNTP
jgi:inhibitor of cysteine peptidase